MKTLNAGNLAAKKKKKRKKKDCSEGLLDENSSVVPPDQTSVSLSGVSRISIGCFVIVLLLCIRGAGEGMQFPRDSFPAEFSR